MKVLVVWPPQVPSYFNAGHHLPTFTVATYLRKRLAARVEALDAGALNVTWKDLADRLWQGGFNVVFIVNDFDTAEGVRRAAEYCRAVLPAAKVCTLGRLSFQDPDYFTRLPLDGIGYSGDYEAVAQTFATWVGNGCPDSSPAGLKVRHGERWSSPAGPGTWLAPEQWTLPDIDDIPYAAYDQLYARDSNRFCGIPERRELVVPVARGCPVNCAFCDVPTMQGLKERRISVARTVSYIRDCFERAPFEYVAFYAPTFTLNRRWTVELCTELMALPRAYPWKCATTMHHLSEDLVSLMSAAGCVRISVGLETLEPAALELLPRAKRAHAELFAQVAGWCRESGVELNCFVIAGLPGTTADGLRHTLDMVHDAGARARPTLYTPYDRMAADMSEAQLSHFNRQVATPGVYSDAECAACFEVYDLLFGQASYVTPAPSMVDGAASR